MCAQAETPSLEGKGFAWGVRGYGAGSRDLGSMWGGVQAWVPWEEPDGYPRDVMAMVPAL